MSKLKFNDYFFLIIVLLLAVSCGDEADSPAIDSTELPAIAEFSISQVSATEADETLTINVRFDRPTPSSGSIEIGINSMNSTAVIKEDYNLPISPNGDNFMLQVDQNASVISFEIQLIKDSDTDEEAVQFQMINATGGVRLANRNFLLVTILEEIKEEEEESSNYANCLSTLKSDELNIVTWNIEFFPKRDALTSNLVADIVKNMDADVIAVQEINSISNFNAMADGLAGWEAQVVNLSGSLDIGYLYKTSEVTVISNAKSVAPSVSPRPPVEITIKHTNGLEVILLNIHLKCCGGSSNVSRRRSASIAMKTYIDNNLPNNNVMILGDFNDDIDINDDTPFSNFIDDASNYKFADADIAAGSQSNWSYPSWPSHIDHILISNELFDNLTEVKTLKMNECLSNYDADVSDHRPIMATFK